VLNLYVDEVWQLETAIMDSRSHITSENDSTFLVGKNYCEQGTNHWTHTARYKCACQFQPFEAKAHLYKISQLSSYLKGSTTLLHDKDELVNAVKLLFTPRILKIHKYTYREKCRVMYSVKACSILYATKIGHLNFLSPKPQVM
jgi:hypothetical protein